MLNFAGRIWSWKLRLVFSPPISFIIWISQVICKNVKYLGPWLLQLEFILFLHDPYTQTRKAHITGCLFTAPQIHQIHGHNYPWNNNLNKTSLNIVLSHCPAAKIQMRGELSWYRFLHSHELPSVIAIVHIQSNGFNKQQQVVQEILQLFQTRPCLSGCIHPVLFYWWRLSGCMKPEKNTCRDYSGLKKTLTNLFFG